MKINDILKEAVLQKSASVPQPGSPELSAWSAAKKQPTQAQQQPAQQQPAQPAAAPAPQKITVGQINKTIPTLRNRDLQSVKKTVDNALGQKEPSPGANAFGQMAQQVTQTGATATSTADQPDAATSSTGGTTQQTPSGQVHTANKSNPNQAATPTATPAAQQQPASTGLDSQGNFDPNQYTPDELRGYKVGKDGKLYKKPGFLSGLKDLATTAFQKATGQAVDPRANLIQRQGDLKTDNDFRRATINNVAKLKAQNAPAQQPAAPQPAATTQEPIEPTMEPTAPKSASGIAKGMRQVKAQPKAQQPAQQQQPGWISTPDGAQVSPATNSHPTLGKYNKQLYSLNDKDQWIDQKGKPATTAIATVLNKALEQT